MSFECIQCGKLFTFNNNLYRHKRKSCKNIGKKHENGERKHDVRERKHDVCERKHDVRERKSEYANGKSDMGENTIFSKIVGNFGKLCDGNKWECLKCKKRMLQQSKNQHSIVSCYRHKYGVNTCIFCQKFYDKTNSRIKHENKCSEKMKQGCVEIDEKNLPIVVNNTTNNITNNITNITNNTIVLNQFGVEGWDCLWKLCSNENKNEFEKMKMQLITQGLDGISKLIEIHYFNKDYPKNQTIRKPIKNNDFVEVHVGNNEWEHKTIETALEEIKQSTTMYIRPLIDDVLETRYEQDEKIKKYTNKMFTDVLVPMKYDLCNEYKDKLMNTDPLSFHMLQQHEQISVRKMKTVLYELSSKLKTLSDNIKCV